MGVGRRKLGLLWALALALACTGHRGHAQDGSSESSYEHHPVLPPVAQGPGGVPLRGVTVFPPLRTVPVVRALNPAHNGRVCSTWGDFHYKTFDGDVFRFPGLCNYVFSEHCGAAYEDFNVQLRRSRESGSPTLSRVLMKVDGMVIQLTKGSVLVHGRPVQLPFSQSGVLIQQSSSYTKVEARLGLVLMWNHDDSLLLELDTKYANKTCGLCGDFNGLPVLSELLSHNTKLTPLEFGNLQKMDGPTEQCPDPIPEPPRNCSTGFGICEELLSSGLFSDCTALVDVGSYLEACRQDLCFCEGTDLSSCVCHTLAEYSRQCAHAGGLPQDWRGPDLCPQICPHNMQYHECRSPCADTCSNQEHSRACEDHCVAGCFCPEGMVLDDIGQTGCVPVSQCTCVYNGAVYAPGATYSTDCTNCTCSGGRWSCQEVPCPGTCSVLGGAHFSTFDGRHYTVHGDCSYVLTKPCDGSTFTVLAELRRCGLTDSETCLKSVTLSLDGVRMVVVIKASGEVFLNQIYTQLPISAANITIFRPSTFFIIAQTSLGLQLDLQLVPTMQLFVRLAPELRGRTCGLCGNFNSIQADDFRTLSGVVEATAAAFFNTFKTQAACPNVRNSFEDPCSLSVENEKYAQHWCSQLTDPDGPFTRCHAAVNPATYYSNCMFDTCNCERSEDCLCATLSSYVHACAAKGLQLSGWRDGVCTKPMTTCPKSMTYHYHISTCQPTCRSLSEGDVTCSVDFVPVDGCACPKGTLLDDTGKCVPATSCPCYHRGSVIPSGESVHDSGAICTCTHGQLSCIGGQAPTTVCAAPMLFFDCRNATPGDTGAGCQKSCHTLDMTCYSPQCVPGCVCPDGLVADGEGGCIAAEDCPCVHNEASYRAGQTIRVGCNTCTCESRMWRCTDDPCLATCAVYGDGHYLTFDSQSYSFNGDCEYTLLQNDCDGNSSAQDSFRVVTENVPCGTTGTTCSKAIKIFLGGSELKLSHGKVEVIGTGEGQEVPYAIRQMGIYLVVDTDVGLVLLWDKKTSIFISLSPEFKGRVCGLCGNFDGNANNDFTTRSRSVVGDALEFGNSWKLSPSCPDATVPKDPCTANPFRKSWAQKQCSILHGPTFAACHAHVEPDRYYEACVNDACACDSGGDCECFCTAVAAYAQACHEVGLCVSWRTPSICPLFCDYYNPEGQCEWHYQPCGAPCLRTCQNPRGDCLQDLRGLEGCYPKCPPETPIFDEEQMQCVARCPSPPPSPPCHVHGKSYRPGTVVPSDKNCHSCLCTERGVQCTYDAKACVCSYDGQRFRPGDVIYHTTDGMGGCISARCGDNGTIERRVYPCSPSTPAPTTTFSFSTPPLVLSSTPVPSTSPSEAHTGPPSSAWSITAGTSPRTRPSTASASPQPACGEECLWSPWLDISRPGRGVDSGDFDTLENLRAHGYPVCTAPRSVECRAEDAPGVPLQALGQHVLCSPDVGLTCRNREQPSGICHNYQVRVLCCTPLPCSTASTAPSTPPTTSKTTETRASASSAPGSTPGPGHLSTARKTPAPGPSTASTQTTRTTRKTPAPGPATSVKTPVSTHSPSSEPATSSMLTTAPGTAAVSSKTSPPEPSTVSCLQEFCTWTEWIDGSYPGPEISSGDFDTFQNLRAKGYKFCEHPRAVECRAESFPNTPLADLEQDVTCSRTEGLICLNKNQLPPICYNYEIRIQCCERVDVCREGTRPPRTGTTTRTTPHRTSAKAQATSTTHKPSASTSHPTATSRAGSTATSVTRGTHTQPPTRDCQPRCSWTKWFDVDFPSPGPHGGDEETYSNIIRSGERICRRPEDITRLQCRAESHPEVSIEHLGQVVQCSREEGLVCRNQDQQGPFKMCLNYEVRVLCCEIPKGCPVTTPVTAPGTPSERATSPTHSTSWKKSRTTNLVTTSTTSTAQNSTTSVPQTSTTSAPTSSTTSAPQTSTTSAPTSSTTSAPQTSTRSAPTTSTTSAPQTSTTSAPTSSTTSAPQTSTTSAPTSSTTSAPQTSTTSAPTSSTTSAPQTSTTSGPGTTPSPVPTTSTTSAPITSTTSAPTTSTTSAPTSSTTSAPQTSTTSAPTSSTTSAPQTSTTSGPGTTPSPVPTTSTTSAPQTSTTSSPGTTPSPVPTTSTSSAPVTSTTSAPTTSTTSAPQTSTTTGPGTTPSPVPTTSTTSAPATSTTSAPTTSTTSAPTTSTTSAPQTSTTSAPQTSTTTGPGTTPSPVPTTSTTSAPATSTTSAPTTSTTSAPTTSTTSAPTTSTTSAPTTSTSSAPVTSTTSAPSTSTTFAPTSSTTSAPQTSTTSGPGTTPSPVPTTSTTSAPITSTTSAPTTSTTSAPVTSTTSTPITSKTSAPTTSTSSAPVTSTTSASSTSTTSAPTTSTTSAPSTSTTSVSKTSTSHVSVSTTSQSRDCQPRCSWTKWFDVDFPSPGPHGGDEETYSNIIRSGERICRRPEDITRLQCRAESHPEVSIEHLGQVVQCSREEGLVCRNQDQQGPFKMCLNYEVRVLCCEIPKGCPVTTPVTAPGTPSERATSPTHSTSSWKKSRTTNLVTTSTTSTAQSSTTSAPQTSTTSAPTSSTTSAPQTSTTSAPTSSTTSAPQTSTTSGPGTTPSPVPTTSTTSTPITSKTSAPTTSTTSAPTTSTTSAPSTSTTSAPTISTTSAPQTSMTSGPGTTPSPVPTTSTTSTPTTSTTSAPTTSTTSAPQTSTTSGPGTTPSPVPTTSTTSTPTTSTTSAPTTSTSSAPVTSTTSASSTSTTSVSKTSTSHVSVSTTSQSRDCQPRCSWTKWFDVDFPSPGPHGGDEETYSNIIRSGERICRRPEDITRLQCRAESHPEVSIEHLGQVVQCSREEGLVCRNQDQQGPFKMCLNYEVRVLCCEIPKGCPVTTPVTAPGPPSERATSPTHSTSWKKSRTTNLVTTSTTSTAQSSTTSAPQTSTTSAPTSSTTSAPQTSTTSAPTSSTTSAPQTSTRSAPITSTTSASSTSTTSAPTTSTTSAPQTSTTSAPTSSTTSAPQTSTTSGPGTTPSPVPTTSTTSTPITSTTSASTTSTTSAPTTSTTSAPTTSTTSTPITSKTSAPTTSTSSAPVTSRTSATSTSTTSAPTTSTTSAPQTSTTSGPGTTPSPVPTTSTTSAPSTSTTSVSKTSTSHVSVSTTSQSRDCQPRCSWTKWFDVDFPSPGPHGGDEETYSNIIRSGERICRRPEDITRLQCRAESHPEVSIEHLGQVVQCSREEGLVCRNQDQQGPFKMCLNYEVRVLCCEIPKGCPVTTPVTAPGPPSERATSPTHSTSSWKKSRTTNLVTTSTTSTAQSSTTSVPQTSTTSAPTSSTTSAPQTSTRSAPITSTTSASSTSTTSAPQTSTTSSPGTTPSPVPTTSTTSAPQTSTTSAPTTSTTSAPTTSTSSAPVTSTTSAPSTSTTFAPTSSTTSAPQTSTTSGPGTTPSPVPTTSTTSTPITSTTSAPITSTTSAPITSTTSAPTTSTTSAPSTSTTSTPITSKTSAPTTSTSSAPVTSTTSASSTSTTSAPTTSTTSASTTSTTSAPQTSTTSGPGTTPSPVPTTSTTSTPITSTTSAPTISTTSAPQTSTTSGPGTTPSPVPTTSTTSTPTTSTTSAPTTSTSSAPVTSTTLAPSTSTTSAPTISTTSAPQTSTTSGPGTTPSPVPTTSTTSAPSTSTTSVSKTSTSHVSVSTTSQSRDCQPRCSWTKWFDVDFPSPGPHGGDEETYSNIIRSGERICRRPEDITRLQCRAESHPEVSIEHLGQVVQCSREEGLLCRNQDQQGPFKMCLNYEVRVLCCETPKGCPVTSISPYGTSTKTTYPSPSTFVPSTSVAFTSVASTSVAPSSVAYTTPTCFCNVADRLYPAGSTIYRHRDLAGHCYYALCSPDCQVVRGVDSDCPSTTPPPALATSPSTATSEPELGCPNAVPPRKKGETWPMPNCSEATCEGHNVISLHPRKCPRVEKPTCANGYPAVKVADQDGCCQHYQCQCVCSGWGDPHYITFDGTYYTFLDNCTYVLVQQIVPVFGHFRVLIDNYFCDAEDGLSCPRSIILEYRQDRVVLTRRPVRGVMTNEIIFNNKVVSPGFQKDGITVSRVGIKMYATIPQLGVQVMFSGLIFSVEVPFSTFANNTEGQCGTCTNDRKDECRMPGGRVAASCSEMSGLWNVSEPGQPACHGPRPVPTPAGPTTARPFTTPAPCPPAPICQLILSKVFEPCHTVIPPLPFYEGCAFDHCHMTDPGVVCSSLELYAALCTSQGICVDWRGHTNHTCPFTCPADTVYLPCGPTSPSYCYGNDSAGLGALQKAGPITEGCFCPEGMVLFSTSAQVCVPTGCPRCLGPHGEPVEGGHNVSVDCRECMCEAATWTLTCRPKPCPLPPACPLPGFVPVPAAPQTGQCCPQYSCACNSSHCPAPVGCPEGAREILTHEEGACCPVQNCSWTVCSINGTLYQPGAVVSSSLCETCRCELPGGPLSDSFVVSCETQICNSHCPVGFEYREQRGQCCGTCVQVACVTNTSDSPAHLFYPGETWSDPGNHCVTHECEKHRDGLVVVTTKKACPPLSCSLDQARMSEDACCLFCPPPLPQNQSTCAVHYRSQTIRQQGCRSEGPVRLAYCQGNCGDSSSMYSLKANVLEHRCQCCQELRTSPRNVTLHCSDGSRRAFRYTEVEECGCTGQRCPAPGDTQHSEEAEPEQSQEAESGSWERGAPASSIN
uniref:mucin-5AC n=1 Tax=Callithrix jacchus TaxID=9483 RepID=UPI0023DD2FD8|nr:mucin-5AC [Callithrix jacchus]